MFTEHYVSLPVAITQYSQLIRKEQSQTGLPVRTLKHATKETIFFLKKGKSQKVLKAFQEAKIGKESEVGGAHL